MNFDAHHNDTLRLATMVRMAEQGKVGKVTLRHVGGIEGLPEARRTAEKAAAQASSEGWRH